LDLEADHESLASKEVSLEAKAQRLAYAREDLKHALSEQRRMAHKLAAQVALAVLTVLSAMLLLSVRLFTLKMCHQPLHVLRVQKLHMPCDLYSLLLHRRCKYA